MRHATRSTRKCRAILMSSDRTAAPTACCAHRKRVLWRKYARCFKEKIANSLETLYMWVWVWKEKNNAKNIDDFRSKCYSCCLLHTQKRGVEKVYEMLRIKIENS